MAYSKILQRIRSEKTNYRKRKIMLMGKRDFITVNITNENTQVQIVKPVITGDKVLASAHSRFLLKDGWKGSRKNIPASYLTGVKVPADEEAFPVDERINGEHLKIKNDVASVKSKIDSEVKTK